VAFRFIYHIKKKSFRMKILYTCVPPRRITCGNYRYHSVTSFKSVPFVYILAILHEKNNCDTEFGSSRKA
jgi:hypothetical protein